MPVIPEWAAQYIGLEYADHGRGPAYDCWGLVRRVLIEQKAKVLPDYADQYVASARHPSVERAFFGGMVDADTYEPIAKGQEQAFDLVVFKIAGRSVHCGVLLTPTHFLHIHAGTGSVVDGIHSPRWFSRIEGFFRAR